MNNKSRIRNQATVSRKLEHHQVYDDKKRDEYGAPPMKRRKISDEISNMQTGDNLYNIPNKNDRECKEMQQTENNVNLRTKIDQLQKLLDKKAQEAGQKEEVLQKLLDEADKSKKSLEENLKCNVCLELFIQATTLSCTHTFCAYCISEWRKRMNQCPICRKEIIKTSRSLTIDNLVEKACETMSSEERKDRSLVVETRSQIPDNATTSESTQSDRISAPLFAQRLIEEISAIFHNFNDDNHDNVEIDVNSDTESEESDTDEIDNDDIISNDSDEVINITGTDEFQGSNHSGFDEIFGGFDEIFDTIDGIFHNYDELDQNDVDEDQTDVDENESDVDENESDVDEDQSDVDENESDVDENESDVDENESDFDEDQSDFDEDQSDVDENESDVDEDQSDVDKNQNDIDEQDESDVDEHDGSDHDDLYDTDDYDSDDQSTQDDWDSDSSDSGL